MEELMNRVVFVISDLHLGGAPPSAGLPRGFRMCTQVEALTKFVKALPMLAKGPYQLVINGDFVDFLAEADEPATERNDAVFVPLSSPTSALEKLSKIADEYYPELFAALAAIVSSGNVLTLTSGNHDAELTYPTLQAELRRRLGNDVDLRLDGRPYMFGNVVIEHGHQYDGWNAIPPSVLAEIASTADPALAPPGSHLVASVMNPMKRRFPFVDLLKPERETVIPILLAFSFGEVRKDVGRVLRLAARARLRQSSIDTSLAFHPISGRGTVAPEDDLSDEDRLNQLLDEALGEERHAEFEAATSEGAGRGFRPVARTGRETVAMLSSIFATSKRYEALYEALKVVQRDLSFIEEVEHDERVVAACVPHAAAGRTTFVVMGHTHLKKRHVEMVPNLTYLNTGTWADLIPFPRVHEVPREEGVEACEEFIRDPSATP